MGICRVQRGEQKHFEEDGHDWVCEQKHEKGWEHKEKNKKKEIQRTHKNGLK